MSITSPSGSAWPDPGGGQLDGKRQAVQPAADLGDGADVLAGEPEPRSDRLRPLGEQPHGGVLSRRPGVPGGTRRRDGERGNREFMLPAEPERAPAGHQHLQAGRCGQQLGEQRSRAGHLLEVVQHEQQPPAPGTSRSLVTASRTARRSAANSSSVELTNTRRR